MSSSYRAGVSTFWNHNLKLDPDYSYSYSCSGSVLWLVCIWTRPRNATQTAQVTRATGSCGLLSVHQRDARNPLDGKTRTGNNNLVVASHRILSSSSLNSNLAATVNSPCKSTRARARARARVVWTLP